MIFPWFLKESDCIAACGVSSANNNLCVGTGSGNFGPAGSLTCECLAGYSSPTNNGKSCLPVAGKKNYNYS